MKSPVFVSYPVSRSSAPPFGCKVSPPKERRIANARIGKGEHHDESAGDFEDKLV